jgi:hypothetical protein
VILALAVLGGAALIILTVMGGLRGLAETATLAAFFLTPMIAVRLNESVTIGDAVLVVAILLQLARAPGLTTVSTTWKLVAAVGALMVLGGVTATALTSRDSGLSAQMMAQYGGAVVLALTLVYLTKPTTALLRAYAYAYGSGAVVSCLVAITDNVSLRPAGLATHSNHLAFSAALAVGVWLALFVSTRKRLPQLACLVGIGICLTATIIAGSRAGLVAIIVTVALALYGTRSGKMVTVGALACIGLAYAFISGRIDISDPNNAILRLLGGGTAGEADLGRAERYRGAFGRIADHPFIGNGFVDAREGHSLYLQMWDAAGIAGLLAAGVLLTAGGFGYWRARKDHRLFAVGLWSGYGGYLVAAILSNQMWDRYIWLALALALMSDRIAPTPSKDRVSSRLGRAGTKNKGPSARRLVTPQVG